VIFHDSALQEMCVNLPQDMTTFGLVSGVGERKLEKYGPAFLRVIADHLT
jgi:ATP-dependent DNA helicase RecQ